MCVFSVFIKVDEDDIRHLVSPLVSPFTYLIGINFLSFYWLIYMGFSKFQNLYISFENSYLFCHSFLTDLFHVSSFAYPSP